MQHSSSTSLSSNVVPKLALPKTHPRFINTNTQTLRRSQVDNHTNKILKQILKKTYLLRIASMIAPRSSEALQTLSEWASFTILFLVFSLHTSISSVFGTDISWDSLTHQTLQTTWVDTQHSCGTNSPISQASLNAHSKEHAENLIEILVQRKV